MASDKPSTDIIPFAKATEIKRLDANTYQANLVDSFCIGAGQNITNDLTVPNGGYVASCILQAAILHGSSRSPSNPQPHVMNAHFEYLNRTQVGPAAILIEDVKPGRQLTTLHATLYQGNLHQDDTSTSDLLPTRTLGKKRVTAYLVMTNLSSLTGLSLNTQFTLLPPPLVPSPSQNPDFSLLKQDRDPHWTAIPSLLPPGSGSGSGSSYIRALQNTHFYIPRRGQVRKSIIDLWIRLSSGEKFTNASLGYVSDCWPYVVEAYRPRSKEEENDAPFRHDAKHWYPTVVMNIEQKKAAPEKGKEEEGGSGGWEWLRMRVSSKEVKGGRFDLEVLVMDEKGELVVVSNHVGLVLGSERNLAGRGKGGMKGQSRI
ncbi:thioesterase-like superfamily-domain-containing protein [Neurospora hispaniola]|uniref:Thioesterase-like superfamily-domain-containing protein n=1 Tax=Neurospora hispaniola TaxID=588809 RepID=A0AAJ0IEM5_9PEZI|nr:thioesterase-like superfamily-domain-containing protein [Neurospora hispaniola]